MSPGGTRGFLAGGRNEDAVPAAGVDGEIGLFPGFDDHPASPGELPLTTVRQPTLEMAAQAGRLLLAGIDSPGVGREPLIHPARLVVRASSQRRGDVGREVERAAGSGSPAG
ncbi:substrate-binding domain-containing protein [Paenarthrobacter sp. DKR-5]|uniref:substrate-binding domain-containing protein n=1 Tax=Paenarthrobacter sp. DKR-5 TaxID=2835535 RepID=UPI0035B08638